MVDGARGVFQDVQDWLFTVPYGRRSAWEIIKWWEVRRFAYNAIVLGVGFVSFCLFLVLILNSGRLKDGEDAVEPLALFVAPILMNIAYTAGPALELLVNALMEDGSQRLGPGLLKIGLLFSLGVVLLPSVLWLIATLLTVLHVIPAPSY